ncbi:hypothetical protein KIW84_012549 [Lathyrus oleraceus]|uniref:DUF7745 domain-containing protein n=1 Tax=Pisum sativum TaxID=3888 RepID=A0A9D5GWU5_PEA|nr:hypothetical protein KIW84_012549 [Pisum sativum]
MPTLEEYAYLLGIHVSDKVPFSGLEEIPKSQVIVDALHLKKSVCDDLKIIGSCWEFSNVPLIGTQGGINYNSALARRQLRFPFKDKPNNIQLEVMFYQEALEPYTSSVKKRALKLKMSYAYKRPMSMVVVELSTLPNQDIEELEDALAKMKQEKDL